MAKMKTGFPTKEKLEYRDSYNEVIVIITPAAKRSFITVTKKNNNGFYKNVCFMSGQNLELFAVNILKALKSKRLKIK
jgi:HEPN domain-containing protein